MGDTLAGTQFVCEQDGACDYFPNTGAGPGTSFADFAGQPGSGDWMICVGDRHVIDVGMLQLAELTVVFEF
jgi:hypothetical protein